MRSRLVVLAVGGLALVAGCSAGHAARPSASPSAPSTSAFSAASPSASRSESRAPSTPARKTPPAARPTASHGVSRTAARTQAHAAATTLPLPFGTGDATQLITVVAPSTGSTTGTLQAWQRGPSGWQRVGGAVPAWLGADGLSTQPSESISATPIGSFTLTNAFGHDPDPGTALPYVQTTPDDWWISQAGPLYNTRQRCASSCPFTWGDPNEHLYYETPYYDYAVVIDYNTRNAPGGVRPGAGSAFFLHVTVGAPTQGCVSIPADQLVRLLRWLSPSAHPRILIGVAGRGA